MSYLEVTIGNGQHQDKRVLGRKFRPVYAEFKFSKLDPDDGTISEHTARVSMQQSQGGAAADLHVELPAWSRPQPIAVHINEASAAHRFDPTDDTMHKILTDGLNLRSSSGAYALYLRAGETVPYIKLPFGVNMRDAIACVHICRALGYIACHPALGQESEPELGIFRSPRRVLAINPDD